VPDVDPALEEGLSDRALQILVHASEGKTDKEIARLLGVKPTTVDWHWRKIRKLLHATDRTQAVCRGLQMAFGEQLARAEQENARLTKELERAQALESELRASIARSQQLLTELHRQSAEEHQKVLAAKLWDQASVAARSVAYELSSISPTVHRRFSPSAVLLGIDAERTVRGERTFYDLVHPEDLGKIYELSIGTMFRPGERYLYVYRLLTPEPRWILDVHQAEFDAEGQLTAVLGIATDIHELVLSGQVQASVARVAVAPAP